MIYLTPPRPPLKRNFDQGACSKYIFERELTKPFFLRRYFSVY